MATTPAHAKPKTVPTWIVDLDGTPTTVSAEKLEIADNGMLVFGTDNTIVRAVAVGHWTTVEFKPPPETLPE